METVLLNDFRRIPEAIRRDLASAAESVVTSGWYILGQHVAGFERDWASYCGCAHAVGVANGMDAIEIGLRALELQPGDEIITTPLTAYATILGILRAGLSPVLADIDPGSGLLSVESVRRCIGPKTRGILLVHLYGQVRDIDCWEELCSKHNLLLLEDAAQAHGASWAGRRAGAIGRWAAYSFYPTKNLGCIGDGGALCTNDEAVSQTAFKLRNYGQSDRYHHPMVGLNSRLDEIQAAFLQALLLHLPDATAKRQQIASTYQASLNQQGYRLLAPPQARDNHVFHLFVILTPRRADLQSHLATRGVQSLIHYPVCAHHQPPTQSLRRDPQGLARAEQFARECLSIPCNPYLTYDEVNRVVDALNAFPA